MKKESQKAEKKTIEIETPIGSGKIDTGNKWLDATIALVVIAGIVIFAVVKYL